MDRNSILGLLLIFLILVGYSLWMRPSPEEKAREEATLDSLRRENRIQDSIAQITQAMQEQSDPPQSLGSDSLMQPGVIIDSMRADAFGAFSQAAQGTESFVDVETELLQLTFTTRGGRIFRAGLAEFRSYDSLPLTLIGGDSTYFQYSFFSGNRLINTGDLYFKPFINGQPYDPAEGTLKVSGQDSVRISMRAYPNLDTANPESAYIEFAYTLTGNNYMFGYDVRLYGLEQVMDARGKYLTLDWGSRLRQQEKSLENERIVTTVYYKFANESVDRLTERKDAKESLRNRLKWIAFKQQFFSMVLIADDAFLNADVSSQTETGEGKYLKTLKSTIDVPFEDVRDHTISMAMYIGPNKFKTLKRFDLELEEMIPLGWGILSWINMYAVIPVFDFLEGFDLNYGIIILLLTIFLKIILFPIAYKTYVSSAKMRILRPEVEEINEKFPKKEDALKKQQATMDLYRKAGVNPMSGCIPMLLQLPILIALFRFFPASIELRQQAFLWAEDLSSYDSVLDLPFNIPFYGDHVSLFTLLMTISTIIYTRMNNQMMSTGNQLPGMKTMLYLMPIMFLGFFNSYASGLSYYYLLTNLITFAQMYIFRLVINEDKLHARIQANKKKPVKKSGFQKRLEEMAKQRGYNPKK